VVISRTHSGLVKRLFEMEVPEISQGVLEIKGVAREAGRRSKVAVFSHDKNVGAVGTCVGHMGSRIQNIVKELGSERVDIIEWNESPTKFIANALSPAKIVKVEIVNEAEKSARVLVAPEQLSLAIGKEGQNVRLAARLTGWKIDIASAEEAVKAKEPPVKEKKEEAKKEGDKIKVHELAKELGKKSKEVIDALGELGIEAKGPTSSITLEEKEKLLSKLKG
jgi:N utilization substance protein A